MRTTSGLPVAATVAAAAIACLWVLPASPAFADSGVDFRIERRGDVRWGSAPCEAQLIERRGDEDGAVNTVELAGPVTLPAGRYDAVVRCMSDEGPVARTVTFAVPPSGPPVRVPVILDPGFLLVRVLRFDTPVVAEVTVFDERGRLLVTTKDKAVIPVSPGRVRVAARVRPGKRDERARPIVGNAAATVAAGRKVEVTVDTTDGALLVTLTDNGRKAAGVAALREPGQGARIVELRAGEEAEVPPGTYDLVTQLEGTHDLAEVVTRGVTIAPGKTTARTVAHRTGALRAVVLLDGKRVGDDAPVELRYLRPERDTPFHSGRPGETLRLAPGPVEVQARRTDGTSDDGARAEARARASVVSGSVAQPTLSLESATLEVITQVGGKPRPLEIEVFAPGGEAPIARASAGPDGRARLTVAPGSVRVRGVLRAPHGPIATEKITLALGRTAVTLNLVVGTAMVQVFEDGVAVPAEVRFFAAPRARRERLEDDDAVLASAPIVIVQSGQDATLEPGTYAVTVKRKGAERRLSDIKVAAGRIVERTVELAPAAAAPLTEKTRARPRLD